MFGARPHSQEAMTNSSTLPTNSLTCPKRCDSQPVSGTEMALATAKLVMTQVPWLGLTPRSPAIAGSDTLAMDVSSTFMNVAADSAIVPQMRADPSSGAWAAPGAVPVAMSVPPGGRGAGRGRGAGGRPGGSARRGADHGGVAAAAHVGRDDALDLGLGLAVLRGEDRRLGRGRAARRIGQRLAVLVGHVDFGIHRQ